MLTACATDVVWIHNTWRVHAYRSVKKWADLKWLLDFWLSWYLHTCIMTYQKVIMPFWESANQNNPRWMITFVSFILLKEASARGRGIITLVYIITRTGIKSRRSLNSGQIGPFTSIEVTYPCVPKNTFELGKMMSAQWCLQFWSDLP